MERKLPESLECRPDLQQVTKLMETDQKPFGYQTWSNLLFLHWRLPIDDIQKTLPPGLTTDSFDDSAWIAIVPFFMRNIRPRGLFPVPWISNFLELNVRTYVKDEQGRPGVWFYSLDTNRYLAYKIARNVFNLNYFHARMSASPTEDGLDYRTVRKGETNQSRFVYQAAESANPSPTEPGSLEHFLVERYRLFSVDTTSNELFTGLVAHEPYRIFEADVPVWDSIPAKWDGFELPAGGPDHICMAESVDVKVYPIEKVR